MTKKNTKKSSTLTKVATRLLLTFALVLALVATSITPAFAAETNETVSSTVTVTIGGVQYTALIKQGQAQLTVGSKAILLSKENVMAAITIDQYGTAWTISYSGRCAGYNYELQKNEPTANLHTYVNNAEQFVTSGNYGAAVKTTTGTINLPNLEEFKKLAGITSSNNNSTSGDNTNNTGNNNSNTNPGNNANTDNNANTGVSGNLNLIETKKVGSTQYTFVVTNGSAQVVKDGKVITIPDKNISEIGIDANGTIIIITNNNGVKEARWYNPTLQTKEVKTNLLVSNPNLLLKDSSTQLVTGVLSNSTIVKVLTVDEQKKVLGIAEQTTVLTNWVETKTVASKNYTLIVNNGIAQIVLDGKVSTIPDKNISEIGIDANGTIIIITNNNGVKEARWYSPALQTKEVKTNLLTSNANCLIKDSNKLVTGVLSNSTIVKVLTVDEQKKVLGIVPETKPESVTVKVDESRVIKKGDYTYVVYDSNGKEVTRYKVKNGILTWRGVKYNIKKVGVIEKSKNLIILTSKDNIFTIDFDTMELKRIFAASESAGKGKKFSRNSRGYTTAYITTKGKRKSVKNY